MAPQRPLLARHRAFEIAQAQSDADLDIARTLFREYQAWLGVDLCFQAFEEELCGLPGAYAPPAGRLLLAFASDGRAAGCVALWPLGAQKGGREGICEMKRLFVRPQWRGTGLGRALCHVLLGEAAAAGYREMWLDTLERLEAAVSLYETLGFERSEPYYDNPLSGVVFMRKCLSSSEA